jgi:hypothetical protein
MSNIPIVAVVEGCRLSLMKLGEVRISLVGSKF